MYILDWFRLVVNIYSVSYTMSIDEATPEEWNRLGRGTDKPEECLMSVQKLKNITGRLYHPSDSFLDNEILSQDELAAEPPHKNQ